MEDGWNVPHHAECVAAPPYCSDSPGLKSWLPPPSWVLPTHPTPSINGRMFFTCHHNIYWMKIQTNLREEKWRVKTTQGVPLTLEDSDMLQEPSYDTSYMTLPNAVNKRHKNPASWGHLPPPRSKQVWIALIGLKSWSIGQQNSCPSILALRMCFWSCQSHTALFAPFMY